LGEARWGAAQGISDFLYLTVGTGIGGGAVIRDQVLHGLLHPEMGHIRIPHDFSIDPYPGGCPFHGDCFEGLASGPAMEARWHAPASTLGPDHPAWLLEAEYLAHGLMNLICTLSPQRIIVGGGVMNAPALLPAVRRRLDEVLAGYVNALDLTDRLDTYVVPPALGGHAGVLGAIELARRAADSR